MRKIPHLTNERMPKEQYAISFGEEDKYLHATLKIEQIRDILYRIILKKLRPIGITPEQTVVLLETHYNPSNKLTPAQLSKALRRDAPATSRILKRMAKEGIILLVRDLEYKNQIRVEITPKGEELRKSAEEITRKSESAFSGLDESELDFLLEILEKVDKSAIKILKKLHLGF